MLINLFLSLHTQLSLFPINFQNPQQIIRLVGVVYRWSLVFLKMAAGGGKVKAITSDSDFQKELALNSESLIVVDFFATW